MKTPKTPKITTTSAVKRLANALQGPITPVQTGINMGNMTTAASSYLDSLVESGKFTRKEVDQAWEQAKKMANANKKKEPEIRVSYAYITSLFNSILGVGKQPQKEEPSVKEAERASVRASFKVNAAARLKAREWTPSDEGFDAGRFDTAPYDACPYPKGSKERDDWEAAWIAGRNGRD